MERNLKKLILPLFFLIGFFLRLLLIPNPGFEADISFWKSWGLAPFDHGIVWSMYNTNNNYPTPFAYILLAMVKIYSLFSDPHNFNVFWNNHNLLFLTLAKLPSILADLGIAGLILLIGSWSQKSASQGDALRGYFPKLPFSFYVFLSLLYLFSPISIIDGAVWGQVDSVGIFIFLLAVLLTVRDKPFLAGIIFMASMMTKLQNMVYGPLFFLFLWQMSGFSGLVRGIAGALLSFFGLNIEFFLARDMGRVISSLTANYDYFPLLSLNAYNIWWIVAKGQGMHVSDKINTIGIVNAKTAGLILFSGGYLLSALTLLRQTFRWKERKTTKPSVDDEHTRFETTFRFLIGLIIVNASFFFFQTQSHERYLFPQSVFLLLIIPFFLYQYETVKNNIKWYRNKTFLLSITGYSVFTIFYFFNLHNALIMNYPKNGLSFLSPLLNTDITIILSYLLTGMFFLFLFRARKIIGVYSFLFSFLFILLSFFTLNIPYILSKPILLTSFAPLASKQDYGTMTINMPVDANGPSRNWDRLSVQYLFYKHGIGTHANSTITYDINKKFSRLTSDYGIDTEAGSQGSVSFEVWGNETLLFRSDVIGRYDTPKHMDVDISGVTLLELRVRDGGNGITDDHADWLNPKLIK